MLYIVSGFRRSGTSMMMNALRKGLHEGQVIYRPDLELGNTEIDGYKPNPNGNWEVGAHYYLNPKFLNEIKDIDNGLVKIFFDGLYLLPMGEYKIIYMLRDPKEIEESAARVEKHLVEAKIPRSTNYRKPFSVYTDYNQEDIDYVLGICMMRRDFDMRFVNYRDVIENPREVFESLEMPIDVDICADTIEKSLYRFRSKNEHSEDRDAGVDSEAGGTAGAADNRDYEEQREERKAG